MPALQLSADKVHITIFELFKLLLDKMTIVAGGSLKGHSEKVKRLSPYLTWTEYSNYKIQTWSLTAPQKVFRIWRPLAYNLWMFGFDIHLIAIHRVKLQITVCRVKLSILIKKLVLPVFRYPFFVKSRSIILN